MAGTLFLVATPIGNLEDITYRAVRILGEVDLIACEDTRHTRVLLDRYGIKTRTISYHEHNERERSEELCAKLDEGKSVAVVSDAGTPGISDPAFRVVRAALERGFDVVPVPGAAAFVVALIASGLPTDEFYFGGFLPARRHARRERLTNVRSLSATLVFYEAPHRISQFLEDAREVLGERKAVVAREITKVHEQFARGRLSELIVQFGDSQLARGEMVVIIDRNVEASEQPDPRINIAQRVAELEIDGLDQRAALKRAAKELGLSRDEAYRRLVSERKPKRDGLSN